VEIEILHPENSGNKNLTPEKCGNKNPDSREVWK
jgi:hypothetical protein